MLDGDHHVMTNGRVTNIVLLPAASMEGTAVLKQSQILFVVAE
jgi:hypothetical protein